MRLPLYQVDAFASRPFTGNPAAICPLQHWLDDALMQSIALENQLSETAFFVAQDDGYALRWFTPQCEVDLCGHATLAAAHVLYEHLGVASPVIDFFTRSGTLRVAKAANGQLEMRFPALALGACTPPEALLLGLGTTPLECLGGMDYLALLESADSVRALRPDLAALREINRRGVIVTARGDDCDFVSRFFAPGHGIDEDPVTGSAHCALAPYWAEKLGRTELQARQLSPRGGDITCIVDGEAVLLRGKAVTFLCGEIHLPDETATPA